MTDIELLEEKIRLLSAMVEQSLEYLANASGDYERNNLYSLNEGYCNLINEVQEQYNREKNDG